MEVSSGTNLIKRKAFTLIELLVVISIIGVLAALTAGAVFKYAAWQRDPTNPSSSVSITINTVKQAVARITQDIQQKAKQDYQALNPNDKIYYTNLGNDLYAKNGASPNFVLSEPDPTVRAIQVYSNTQIVKNFPFDPASLALNYLNVSYNFDFNPDQIPSTPTSSKSFSMVRPTVLTLSPNANPRNYNNFYQSFPSAMFSNSSVMSASSISQQLLIANAIKKKAKAENFTGASNTNRSISACLLFALESHPKGLKVEDLGSGSVVTDTTGARIIKPGGVVVYHKIHYVDTNDYNADKSLKVGSLRVDIVYDTE